MAQSFRIRRVGFAVAVVLVMGAAAAWYLGVLGAWRVRPPSNSLMILAPYRYNGTWVFDDSAASLFREPFVGGIPEMIDRLVADIPDAQKGFRLLFSAQPFPGYQQKLVWLRGDSGGNWYRCEELEMEGWLCPALFRYYREAPQEIYVKAEAK